LLSFEADSRLAAFQACQVKGADNQEWLNEPPVWRAGDGRLHVVTGPKSDFWRVTHYGFVRDNGHFYYEQRAGAFTIHAKIEAKYEALNGMDSK
jgi:regulation of enolase protein 1 (concanavalin A-like superfamily)